MVYFANLYLSEKSFRYYLISYTPTEVLAEVGGLFVVAYILLGIALAPLRYNLSRIQVMKDFIVKGDHHEFSNLSLSIQSMIYDVSEATCLTFLKNLVSRKFKGINAKMNELADQHFELTNLCVGMKGANIQYDEHGQVLGLSVKIQQDER